MYGEVHTTAFGEVYTRPVLSSNFAISVQPRMDLFAGRCEHVLILEVKFICVLLHYTSTQGGETRNALNSEQTREAHPTRTRHTVPCVGGLCVSDPTPSHP